MDKLDKKIIKELALNSRIPLNQLGKKARVSREVALYRVNRLIKAGIIKHFYTIINPATLGFSRYGFFIQLKKVTKEKEEEIFESLISHKAITYTGPLVGRWNFALDIMAKDRKQLNELVKDLLSGIHQYIKKYVIIETTSEDEFYPTKIVGIRSAFESRTGKYEQCELGFKEKEILKLLAANSRTSCVELAKKVKLSANAIRYKIREFEKKGIILGYTLSLDFKKLGLRCFNLQIKLTNADDENKLKAFIREDIRTLYFYRYLGNENWDFDVGIIAENEMRLRDFLIELREHFGDSIEYNDFYIILEERKPYLPEIVFED